MNCPVYWAFAMMGFFWTRRPGPPSHGGRLGPFLKPTPIPRCMPSCIANVPPASIATKGPHMAKSTAVGTFVLGALALAVAAIILLGGERLFSPRLRVVAYFQNSVAGLTVG